MIAVILAAGQGTRLRPLTNELPKAMVDLNGRPFIAYILDSIPNAIDTLIIVTGYQGEILEQYVGDRAGSRPVHYVRQTELNGTAGALWNARSALESTDDRFLVLHGDNLFGRAELDRLSRGPLALGVHRETRPGVQLTFDADTSNRLTGAHVPTTVERTQPILVCTGSYVLDRRIFAMDPVGVAKGELGLPQTVVEFAKTTPIQLFEHRTWHEINTLEDLKTVRQTLAD